MHFFYLLATLASTALALPAHLMDSNSITAIMGEPLLGTPAGVQGDHQKREDSEGLDKRQNISLTFQQRALLHHNLHRRNHSAPDVTWDSTIARHAQTLAQRCNFQHNTSIGGGGYGQNIAAGLEENNITATVTDLWYGSEFRAYSPYYGTEPDMSNFGDFGHFTQVVWNGTGAIGCFVADCRKSGLENVGSRVPPYLTVCNYKAPGNYVNQFKTNVGRPKGQPVAKWNTGL